MAKAGRPQGAPRGRSRAANELAALLREVTAGLTVRELAQRFGGGKTAWSEYRSGARVIPLGRLGLVIKECVRDPRGRQESLARARRLHDQALTAKAEAEASPEPGLDDALRRAQEDLAASGRLVEGLLALMTMLQEQAKVERPGKAEPSGPGTGTGTGSGTGSGTGTGTGTVADPGDAPSAGPRIRLDELLDQLVAARAVEESARQAVADVRAQCDAAHRPPRLPVPATGTGAGTGDGVLRAGDDMPAATAVDPALSTELARVHHLVAQQREDAHWLWQRARGGWDHSDVVEGVVLERLDTLPAVYSAVPPGTHGARPAGRFSPGRASLAVLAISLVLALGAGAALLGVVLGRRDTVVGVEGGPTPAPLPSGPGTPGAKPTPPPTPTPSPSPSITPAPSPTVPRTAPSRTPRDPDPVRPTTPVRPPSAPAPDGPGTAYAVSPDRHSVLRWTGREGAWKVIGPAAERVYAGAAGLFTTNPGDGRIFKYDEPSSSWSQIGFPGEQFVTAGDGLYAITEHRNAVMRWTGQGAEWVPIGGGAARLYAGGAGLFATSPASGALFRYAGYGDSWVDAGGPGADFAVGPDYVARLSPDGKEIWQANAKGSNWHLIGGPARKLFAGGAGLFAVDATTGQILKYDGAPGSWTPIGASGIDLAVGEHSVYRIADGLAVSRWTGNGAQWTPLGISASSIATVG
ncbi:hypothetical protein ACFV9E_17100 [Streptomyces sp. NPDC059835]|uniref:hypothetical protein n=1 Tax=Streptomyces sp. NPDC059835 TaxID=3346967 RepID=UPI0036630E3A